MRHIKYEATLVDDKASVRILEQTHRQDEFTPRGEFFKHGGIALYSRGCPALSQGYPNRIYLRGWDEEYDNDEIIMSLEMYAKFKAAVEEYNRVFA